MTRVINISSAKGGVGKTTVAINLGVALAKQFNKKVTLIDCNFTTSHVGLYLGMHNTPITLNNVMRGESALEEAMYKHDSGLVVIPASLSLSDLHELEDASLKRVVEELSKSFDVILLDSAPGVGREALMPLKACNEVLYVANPFIPSVTDVAKVANLASGGAKEIGNIKQLGVVMNRVKGEDYELSHDEIKSLANLPVINDVPEDENILRTVNSKVPVILSKPTSKSSKAFMKLAAKLMGKEYKKREYKKRREYKRKKYSLLDNISNVWSSKKSISFDKISKKWNSLRRDFRFNINIKKFMNKLSPEKYLKKRRKPEV